ncbi:hypothetical protein DH2020_024188 [Rehmannia glutinosa]|uniref:Reverse transcriptase zinc-binding domain-containing protein n=1 Tax=Rehmannia glutinosa TaxID=99300 RepID=A0ABR0W9M5_REHGL
MLSRGDPISVKILLDCLDDFGSKSGLKMNILKSNIFMAGIKERDSLNILSFSQLTQGSMPFRYLGIPLAAERLKVAHYEELIAKIREYISGWSASTLSYAGRTELIRSVVQGVECFWLSIFPIPNSVRDKIIQICRNFLWGTGGKAHIAWTTICLPKDEGGLGIRDLQAWNHSLLAKTLWNIHARKDSLWYRWIHHYYLHNRPFRDWTVARSDSNLIKNIYSIRTQILHKYGGNWQKTEQQLINWHNNHQVKGPKNVYNFFRDAGTKKPWAGIVWASGITPKHSFTLWLAAHKRIQTKDRLGHLELEDGTCNFCAAQPETAAHLFFNCPFSAAIWDGIKEWTGISRQMTTLSSAFKWLKKEARGTSKKSKGQKIAMATTVYQIWNARNRLIFEGEVLHIDFVIHKIKTHIYKIMYSLYPHVLIRLENSALHHG